MMKKRCENALVLGPKLFQTTKDFVVIQMTDTDGNAIVPVENNTADQDAGRQTQRIQRAKETGATLANQLLSQAATGDFSTATIREAAEALSLLAKA